MKIKYTRKQYIIHKECDHRTYWSQFVTEWVKKLVLQHIPKEELMASQDPHFNDIPMQRWDQMHAWVPQHVKRAMAESNATMYATETRGRYYSLSDMTCLLKEAAQQIVEETQKGN